MKANPAYRAGKCTAAVADITAADPFRFVEDALMDICTMVFVLSAIQPAKMPQVGTPHQVKIRYFVEQCPCKSKMPFIMP